MTAPFKAPATDGSPVESIKLLWGMFAICFAVKGCSQNEAQMRLQRTHGAL